MENLATKAERDSIKYMQIRFMEDHKDEDFLGVITGVNDSSAQALFEIDSNGVNVLIKFWLQYIHVLHWDWHSVYVKTERKKSKEKNKENKKHGYEQTTDKKIRNFQSVIGIKIHLNCITQKLEKSKSN